MLLINRNLIFGVKHLCIIRDFDLLAIVLHGKKDRLWFRRGRIASLVLVECAKTTLGTATPLQVLSPLRLVYDATVLVIILLLVDQLDIVVFQAW